MASEYLNNKKFESVIEKYKKSPDDCDSKKELTIAFYTLVKNIVSAFPLPMVDQDDAIQEGVLICFEKLHLFDPKKGKAFNFCTTIILNHYRQLYRCAKNYLDMISKYQARFIQQMQGPQLQNMRHKKKPITYLNRDS